MEAVTRFGKRKAWCVFTGTAALMGTAEGFPEQGTEVCEATQHRQKRPQHLNSQQRNKNNL